MLRNFLIIELSPNQGMEYQNYYGVREYWYPIESLKYMPLNLLQGDSLFSSHR